MPIEDRFGRERSPSQELIRALRELPMQQPQPDLWPQLAASLVRQRRVPAASPSRAVRRRRSWWLAVAAVAVLAVTLPRLLAPPSAPTVLSGIESGDVSETSEDLIARSQWLERLVDAPALSPAAQDADQLLIELGLRERIGRIDAALAAADEDDATALWQARVGTLTRLAEVRWAGQQLAWTATATANAADVTMPAMRWSN